MSTGTAAGGQNAATPKKPNFILQYFRDFGVLKETRKEYWALQAINALDCTAYFAMFNVAVVCLSQDFGFNDVHAGEVFALFTTVTTLALFVSGLLTDWLGVKASLYISMIGLILTRASVVVAAHMHAGHARDGVVISAMFFMAPFAAMLQTVFQAANKRFTTKRSRSAGFNLWYLFMNVGAAAGGFLVDFLYLKLGLPRFQIFTVGVVTGVLCMVIIIFFIKHTEQIYGADETPEEVEAAKETKHQNPIQIAVAVASEPAFWRFTGLVTMLMGVRAVFLYLALLHPKFWLRTIGPHALIGTLQMINPIGIIIGLIVLIPILNRFNVFKMLVFGSTITALSLFIQGIPPLATFTVTKVNWLFFHIHGFFYHIHMQALVPFGTFHLTQAGLAQWTYLTTIGFMVVETVGELIWSPRLQEYTAAIAPKGQEGTYLGLSMVPYFLAKTLVSVLSGEMLDHWCPKGIGPKLVARTVPFWRTPYAMWIILASVALAGALGAWALKDWFTKGASFEPEAPTAASATVAAEPVDGQGE